MSGRIVRNARPIKDTKRTVDFSIIIPSAGEGVRMKSFGPRSLLVVSNGFTLLEYQVNILNDIYPNNDIILVSGFEAARVMNKMPSGVIGIENERYTETNVVRSIGIGLRAALHNHVLIVYGDLMFNEEIFDFPIDKSCIVYANEPTISSESEIGCIINNNKLENMFYGLPNRWLSIVYLTGKELKLMKSIAFDKQKERFFGFEAINEIIDKGGEFMAYSPKGTYCIDIDSSKDIENVKNFGT